MVEGKPLYGMTEERYRAVVALVDDRMRDIRVLRSDFDRLEAAVQALTEAQRQAEERVNELAEIQKRTEERLEHLEAAVQALAEAQRRTEERVSELAGAMRILVQEMVTTRKRLDRIEDRLALLYGWRMGSLYRERAHAYFGSLLRRVRIIPLTDIEEEIEAHLSGDEVMDLLELDLLVSGRVHQQPEFPEVWPVVEVSAVVDWNDVERAARRAELLRRLGRPVVAAVAGERITSGGEKAARARQVLLVRDGQAIYWEQVLQMALSAAARME